MVDINAFTVIIDNKEYYGWKSFTVTRSLDSFCGTFNMTLVNIEEPGKKSVTDLISVDSKCIIKIGNDELMVGRIFQRERSVDGSATGLSISGRDITGDMVDCSAIHTSNFWSNADLATIARDLAKPFGIFVDTRINSEPFKSFAIQQGESAHSALDRACKQHGVLCFTNRFGDVVLTNINPTSGANSYVNLEYGKNIKALSESTDYTDRFATYYIKGQDSGNGNEWTLSQLQRVGKAHDAKIKRYRPLIVVNESKSSAKAIATRAGWEAQIRAGRSSTFTVTVRNFRQDPWAASNNPLWEIGDFVNLIHPAWEVNDVFVVAEITYQYGTDGTTTEMTLRNPKTYQKDPNGEVKF